MPPVSRGADGQRRGRAVNVRRQVLNAALECFGAFGFEGTSTRAVAERAGISHPLLLYHFGSKEQLWRSTMEAVIGEYRQALDARLGDMADGDAAAGLRIFIDNFVRFSAQRPQLYRVMTQESTQRSDRIHWLIDEHLRPSFERVVGLIVASQGTASVRAGDPARMYYAIIGMAGTLLSVSTEFQLLTGRNVFDAVEIEKTIACINDFVFVATDDV